MDDEIIEGINSFFQTLDNSPNFKKKSERLGGYIALIDRNDRKLLNARQIGHKINNIKEYRPLAIKEAMLLVGKKEINSYRKSKSKNANAIVMGVRIISLAGNFSKDIAEAILIAATNNKDYVSYVYIDDKKFGHLLVSTLVAHLSQRRENSYIKFLMSI